MEQKTEASQAVNELLPCPFCGFPASLKSVNDWHSVEVDHDGNCPLAWSGASLHANSVDAKWITSVWNSRAFLKTQPAPTEATEKPFGYFIVEGDDLPYPGSGFIRELAEGRVYRSVTPVYTRPAPTEAPNFCSSCGKRLHTGSIHTCTPPAPTEATQGEDSARLDYEATFQSAITSLVMCHIDRMNDICEEDTAVQVVESFVDGFDPLFDLYIAAKFPGRARASAETGGVKP